MASAAASPHDEVVEVTLNITDENGETQSVTKSIPSGPTKVDELKQELGVQAQDALWVIDKHGKRRQLADHASEVVRQGDRYEVIVRGGVS